MDTTNKAIFMDANFLDIAFKRLLQRETKSNYDSRDINDVIEALERGSESFPFLKSPEKVSNHSLLYQAKEQSNLILSAEYGGNIQDIETVRKYHRLRGQKVYVFIKKGSKINGVKYKNEYLELHSLSTRDDSGKPLIDVFGNYLFDRGFKVEEINQIASYFLKNKVAFEDIRPNIIKILPHQISRFFKTKGPSVTLGYSAPNDKPYALGGNP